MKHLELSDQLLVELKLELVSKKIQLEEQVKDIPAEDSFAQPDRDVGNAEDADEAAEQTSHLESELKMHRSEKSLGQVEKALARMESGEYGFCEVCGEAIPLERLQAFPEATTCVEHSQ